MQIREVYSVVVKTLLGNLSKSILGDNLPQFFFVQLRF